MALKLDLKIGEELMVEGNTKEDRLKEQKIEEYLREYRQKLGPRKALHSETEAVEGIEDILEEFHAKSSPQKAAAEQLSEESDAWLPDRISEEELNDFDSRNFLVGHTDAPEGVTDSEAIELYQSATDLVLESISRAEKDQPPNVEEGKQLVQRMDELISQDSGLLLAATDRIQEFAVSTHCVNVAILGLRISRTLNYSEEMRMKVGLAALLHEIGVVKLAKRMVHERGKVSQKVRLRPLYSAELLERLGPKYAWLAETVRQVYEREDGTGFPEGLAGKDIREEAKVLGIVDVLEACIHERPYRRALTGYQLFHELTSGETGRFSNSLVKALLKCFSLYPYNEYVLLNTGEIGVVIEVNANNLLRPRLRILYDSHGKPLREQPEVDLDNNTSRHITKAITYGQLPAAG